MAKEVCRTCHGEIIIIITANELSLGGSGYFTCIQNMKSVYFRTLPTHLYYICTHICIAPYGRTANSDELERIWKEEIVKMAEVLNGI